MRRPPPRVGRLLAGVCALALMCAGTAGGQAPSARAGATTGVVEGLVLGPDEAPVRGAAVRVLGPDDVARWAGLAAQVPGRTW